MLTSLAVTALLAVQTVGPLGGDEPNDASTALTPGGPVVAANTIAKADGTYSDPATGAPFTGIVTESYPNGARKLRVGVRDGRPHGVWLEWHQNGAIRYYGEWRDGFGHGTWLYFHENGRLRARDTAVDDVWHGPSESWDQDGRKTREAVFVNGEETRLQTFEGASR